MNRVLKFRGKVKGEWWYTSPDDNDYWEQFWALVDRNTVGQFVDLQDKHGKEVYEGDIVKAWVFENPGETVEEVTEIVSIYEGLLAPFYMRVNFEEDWWKDALVDGFEVIGNIYENPELTPK